MSPWDVLGLAQGCRDKVAIKRGYAAALRQHRPDQDPVGFQRVRQAYEFLLRLADLPASDDAPLPQADEDAAVPAVSSSPAAPLSAARISAASPDPVPWQEAEPSAASVAALPPAVPTPVAPASAESGSSATSALPAPETVPETRESAQILADLHARFRADELDVGSWSQAVLRLAPTELIVASVDDALLLHELDRGGDAITGMCLRTWHQGGAWSRLQEFAGAFAAAQANLCYLRPGRILAAVAGMLAIAEPLIAQDLLDAAFKERNQAGDERMFRQVEDQVRAGQSARGLPAEQRHLLASIIRDEAWDCDTSTPAAKGLLRSIALFRLDSHLRQHLERTVPIVMKYAARTVSPRERRAARKAQAPMRPARDSSSGSLPGWVVWIGIVLIIKLLAAVGSGAFNSSPTPQPVPMSYDYQKQMREHLRQSDLQYERELMRTIDVPPAGWNEDSWRQLSVEARVAIRRQQKSHAPGTHLPAMPHLRLEPQLFVLGEEHRRWLDESDPEAPPPGWKADAWRRMSQDKKDQYREILRQRLEAAATSPPAKNPGP